MKQLNLNQFRRSVEQKSESSLVLRYGKRSLPKSYYEIFRRALSKVYVR